MYSYASRAVPWLRIMLAASLVVILVELVRWKPWTLWPLEGAAVGLLAGAAAWCFDETAAVVVDPTPRGPAWRALARSPAIAVLVLTWTLAVIHAGDAALFGHRDAVLLQGYAAISIGAGYACWRRSRGEASPGSVFAGIVVPAATAWALVRPFGEYVAVFPYGTTSARGWDLSTVGWLAVGAVAMLALVGVLAEVQWCSFP